MHDDSPTSTIRCSGRARTNEIRRTTTAKGAGSPPLASSTSRTGRLNYSVAMTSRPL